MERLRLIERRQQRVRSLSWRVLHGPRQKPIVLGQKPMRPNYVSGTRLVQRLLSLVSTTGSRTSPSCTACAERAFHADQHGLARKLSGERQLETPPPIWRTLVDAAGS